MNDLNMYSIGCAYHHSNISPVCDHIIGVKSEPCLLNCVGYLYKFRIISPLVMKIQIHTIRMKKSQRYFWKYWHLILYTGW